MDTPNRTSGSKNVTANGPIDSYDNPSQERSSSVGMSGSASGSTSMGGSSSGSTGTLEKAQDKAADVADEAKQAASNVAGQAQEKAMSLVNQQTDRAAESVASVAQALRQAGNQLSQNEQGGASLGQYANTAADQIENISGYLRDADVGKMLRDVEDFGRREPALFLGGALAAGLLLARFFKSSSPDQGTSGRYSYDRRNMYGSNLTYTGRGSTYESSYRDEARRRYYEQNRMRQSASRYDDSPRTGYRTDREEW
jgi:hypothetical protein